MLFFYFGDFNGKQAKPETIVASTAVSLSALSSEADKFKNANTHIRAVSRDSLESHVKLVHVLKLHSPFPLRRDDTERVSGSTCHLTSNLEFETVHS